MGLGNATATGTDNNSQGYLRLYGPNTGYSNLTYANSTSNVTHTLPAVSGTIVLGTGTADKLTKWNSTNKLEAAEWNTATIKLGSPLTISANSATSITFTSSKANTGSLKAVRLLTESSSIAKVAITGWELSSSSAKIYIYNPTSSSITLSKESYIIILCLE